MERTGKGKEERGRVDLVVDIYQCRIKSGETSVLHTSREIRIDENSIFRKREKRKKAAKLNSKTSDTCAR